MNTRYITRRVAEMAPALSDCRVDDAGGGIFAFHCKREGMARCIQFDKTGVYGASLWSPAYVISDEAIAIAVAMELSK
jgi:hypothetical protein